MTEHIAKCRYSSYDQITAYNSDISVSLSANTEADVCLSPSDARTFARGILALADEVDGGEAPETSAAGPIKVGDRVEITRYRRSLDTDAAGRRIPGRVGTVVSIDRDDSELPYFVELSPDEKRWAAEVRRVAEEAPEPLADWERDLLRAASPAVGDRVRVVRPEYAYRLSHAGALGTLTEGDAQPGCRYRVRTDDDVIVWAFEVEPAPEDEPAETPTDEPANSRAAYLKQAEDMASSYIDSARDLVEVARFLAGE